MKKIIISILTVFGLLILSACGGQSQITTDDVVKAFKDAELEAEDVRQLTKDDYGFAPMKADEGVRFLIPSLGEDSGGRIFSYSNQSDLEEMKKYYDSMGEESAMLFSWTIAHENILVQINGDLPEEKYNEYKSALESL